MFFNNLIKHRYSDLGEFSTCEWFGAPAVIRRCDVLGDKHRNFGKTANEACCECGGGSTVILPPSLSPLPSPSPPSQLASPSPSQLASPSPSQLSSPSSSQFSSPLPSSFPEFQSCSYEQEGR